MTFSVGGSEVAEDLRHWVNGGLMALFFFVVGLEIETELVAGELSDGRRAALPAAAIGGMVAPTLGVAIGLFVASSVRGELASDRLRPDDQRHRLHDGAVPAGLAYNEDWTLYNQAKIGIFLQRWRGRWSGRWHCSVPHPRAPLAPAGHRDRRAA